VTYLPSVTYLPTVSYLTALVVAGPLQARPILIQAQATLISLPSNHTEERIIRKQEGTMPNCRRSPDAVVTLVLAPTYRDLLVPTYRDLLVPTYRDLLYRPTVTY
jgi:hypothetical protein